MNLSRDSVLFYCFVVRFTSINIYHWNVFWCSVCQRSVIFNYLEIFREKKNKKIIRKGIRAVPRQIFLRRTFRRRTVRRMTFLRTDISPNHVFLFRSKFKINLRKIQGKFNLIVYIFLAAKKVVDSIVHGLLLAKLSAYGFDYDLPEPINSFLSDRNFRRKTGSSYSLNH